ncbi:MAG: hypothetical protein KDC83_02340 [Flavobacteriales bacterium]|nr:hypothetical protein [Flavobacteriales bacterium]
MQKIQKDTLPDLSGYRNRLDIINEVALQIEKDLLLDEHIALTDNADKAYTHLMSALVPIISKLFKQPPYKIKSLLYRIDVNEKKLFDALRDEPEKSEAEIVSHLIIERELRKVVFRKMYSQTSNP